jgi:3',5'-cyclic AMP phosphodiesterase CpdA
MKFIHLSDTHLLGSRSGRLYGVKPAKRLQKAFKSIREHHYDAACVVITGDLTQSGEPDAYALLHEMIDTLPMPVFPLMGNHDNREAFGHLFGAYMDGGFVQYVREFGERVFVFLDTLVEGEEYGLLCDARLAWLHNRLEMYADRPVYLLMHHHPIPSGLHRMDTVGLFRSSEPFWALLSRYSNIRHIFFGHLHRPVSGRHRNIMLNATRSTAFQVAYRPEVQEEHLSVSIQPAYNVVTLDGDNAMIHVCEYLSEYGVSRVEA